MNLNTHVADGTAVTGVVVAFCAHNLPVVQFIAAVIAIVVGLPHAIKIAKFYYNKWFHKQ